MTPSNFKGCQNSANLGSWIQLEMIATKHTVFSFIRLLTQNAIFSQNRRDTYHVSFCSFLASISPGWSWNFFCSSRKSSDVVFSFKTLTSFYRPSTSLLSITHSISDSFSRCFNFSILSL